MREHVDSPESWPNRSNHPLGSSVGESVSAQKHRQELFGDYREVEVDPEDDPDGLECPDCGKVLDNKRSLSLHQGRWCQDNGMEGDIGPEEARSIYREYWTSDRSQREVGEEFGRSQHAVSDVTKRPARFKDVLEPVAKELGYPDERDWGRQEARKVEA